MSKLLTIGMTLLAASWMVASSATAGQRIPAICVNWKEHTHMRFRETSGGYHLPDPNGGQEVGSKEWHIQSGRAWKVFLFRRSFLVGQIPRQAKGT